MLLANNERFEDVAVKRRDPVGALATVLDRRDQVPCASWLKRIPAGS